MTHSNRMIELVLARDEAVEAYQEKLSRIVVKHHEQLGALLNALPKVTGEVLAALVPDLATRMEKTIPEMIQAQAEELRGHLSVEQLEAFSELAEEAQKTRNELAAMIDAGMAQITAERVRVVEASEVAALLSDKLTGIAKSAAKQVTLAVPEVKALVTDMLAAQPKQLAATSGTALLDLFRGEFSSGTQAKRGEIWTFNGGTYICTEPTEFEPGRTNSAWALLAAPGQRGFPGVNGSVSAGGGSGTVTSVSVTTANGVSGSVATDTTTPAISITLDAITPTTVNKVTLTTPATGSTLTIVEGKTLTANNTLTLAGTDGTTMTFPSTSATVARTDAANTFTGVQTMPGSLIRTPATITITEASPDTGTIDITSGYSQATIDEATTLTPSAAGTNGQFVLLDIINSGSGDYVVTVDTASDFTFTAAANATTTALIRSNGSGWMLVGGDPYKVEKIAVFSVDGGGSAISSGTVSGTVTLPAAFRLVAYSITATANSGTITVNIWRAATGTSIPAVGGNLNTSGVTLVTNTAVKSTTLTDFAVPSTAAAQAFAAYDMLRCAYTVTGNATDLTVTLYGVRV